MAARGITGVLTRRTAFPSTYFTNLSSTSIARPARTLAPRYFVSSQNLSKSTLPIRSSLPFTNIFRIFQKSPSPSRHFSSITRRSSPFSSISRSIGRRHFSSTADPTTPAKSLTIRQRWQQLSKEYGYSALGVYLLLTVLDFPFCFLLVRYVGSEKIAHYEHIVIEGFWSIMPDSIAQFRPAAIKESRADAERQILGGDLDTLARGEGLSGTSVAPATGSTGKGKTVSIWTELALAYAVHKSLIFFRLPLAVAITPKIVQKLRGWGFNIGKKGGVRQGVADVRERRAEMKAIKKAKSTN